MHGHWGRELLSCILKEHATCWFERGHYSEAADGGAPVDGATATKTAAAQAAAAAGTEPQREAAWAPRMHTTCVKIDPARFDGDKADWRSRLAKHCAATKLLVYDRAFDVSSIKVEVGCCVWHGWRGCRPPILGKRQLYRLRITTCESLAFEIAEAVPSSSEAWTAAEGHYEPYTTNEQQKVQHQLNTMVNRYGRGPDEVFREGCRGTLSGWELRLLITTSTWPVGAVRCRTPYDGWMASPISPQPILSSCRTVWPTLNEFVAKAC